MPAPKSNTVRGAFTRIIFEGSAANVIANFVAGSSTNDKFPHLGDLLTGADGPEKEPRNEAEHSSTVSDEKTTSIRQHIAVIQKQLQPWGTVSNLECKPLVVELLTRDIEKTLTDLHSGKIKRNINEFLKQHVDEQPLRLEFLGVESMEEFAATEPEFQELEAIAERYINKLMSDLNKHFVTESVSQTIGASISIIDFGCLHSFKLLRLSSFFLTNSSFFIILFAVNCNV